MRIRTKLALLFIFLSLLIISGLSYLAYVTSQSAIQRNVSDQLLDMNLLKEAEIARWVASNERSLSEFAQRPLVREYAAELIFGELSEPEWLDIRTRLIVNHLLPRLEVEGGFLDLSVLHPVDGKILASTEPSLEGKYRENRTFFLQGRSGTFSGGLVYEMGGAEVVMHVSTPILDATGDLLGVLAGHADLGEMSKITMQRSGFAIEEDTYLVNKFNFFVTEPAFGDGYALRRAIYTDGVALALEGETGVAFYDDYIGTPVLGAYRWIEERELAIITEISVSEAFAPVRRLRNTLAGIGGAAVLAALSLSFLFAHGITKRLETLVTGAEKVAGGNLFARITNLGKDELGDLGHSFNEMTENLQMTTASRDELAREVAERIRAEENLRQSEERYRTFVDNASDAFYLVDMDGQFLDVNEAACVDSGYAREELLNLSVADVDAGFSPDAVSGMLARMTRHETRLVESVYKRKNGETFPVEMRIRSFGPKDHPLLLALVRDITERVSAEQTLKQERDRAQTYLDVAAVAMIALDKEGRITLVNSYGSQMLGFSQEELLGQNWFEACIPTRLQSEVRTVFKELMGGVIDPVEYYENLVLTKDGEERIVAWHNALIHDDEGAIAGTLSSGRDITERVRAERERLDMEAHLRQAQKLESIGTLASGVAHEINNPLMGMINYADLIGERDGDDTVKEYSQVIMKEGSRIAEIVRNLLSFSRQDRETHSPARIRDIIDSSLTLIGSTLRKDQIKLDLDIAEDLPSVKCRSQQIQQVIINLLTNAHDALNERYPEYDENKIIRMTVRPFEKEGEDWIRTTIEDHGSGIYEEVSQRIFDPFYTTKSRGKGTGLGLSVSFGIVREHQGELTVESVPGEYTRFHVDLRVDNRWGSKEDQEEVA